MSDRPAPSRAEPREVSQQAVRLHAFGVIATLRSERGGLLGRDEAEHLAERCGALVEEVVDAGLWLEFDLGYRVVAGALTAAWRQRHTAGAVAALG